MTQRFEIQEIGGDKYSSLEEAWRAAVPYFAQLLACIVREGIEGGRFVVGDGVVMLAPRCESEGTPTRGCTNGENDV